MSANQQFLTQTNFQKVTAFLRKHYTDRMGVSVLPERVSERIQNTVQHYMTEVWKANGANQPPAAMNQEVLR
jgi:hypothetical protein